MPLPLIEDALTDTIRQKAASNFTKPGFEIYVEGKIDKLIIEKIFPHLTVQNIGIKQNVIDRVIQQEHTIGIVDTDSDFEHSQVNQVHRCIDTGELCCFFALLFDEIDIEKIFARNRSYVDKKNSQNKKESIENISTHIKNIIQLMKIKTETRLFRNHISMKFDTLIGYNNNNFTIDWGQVIVNMEKITKRQISDVRAENFNDYIKFTKLFEKQLRKCGINDHSLEDVIYDLIKDDYSSFPFLKNWFENNKFRKKVNLQTQKELGAQIKKLNQDAIISKLKPIIDFISKRQDEFERQKKTKSELNQCEGITQKGVRCKRKIRGNFCFQHDS